MLSIHKIKTKLIYLLDNYDKKVIKDMTGGGVDYSFECVGLASLLNEAFISTRTVRLY